MGTIWGAGDGPQVSCLQEKYPSHHTIVSTPFLFSFTGNKEHEKMASGQGYLLQGSNTGCHVGSPGLDL